MTNEYESVRDEIKNEVILEMRNHIDSTAMTILGQVLNKVLSNVEIVKTKMLPSTTEDVNSKIIELFKRISQKSHQLKLMRWMTENKKININTCYNKSRIKQG